MLEDGQVEPIKAELRWLTRELDDARNLDVFITETFRPAAKRHARSMGLANLGRALITAQTRAYDRAEAALAPQRFRTLMLETAAWIETGAVDERRRPRWRRCASGRSRRSPREILDEPPPQGGQGGPQARRAGAGAAAQAAHQRQEAALRLRLLRRPLCAARRPSA